jgi:hypothetical protein
MHSLFSRRLGVGKNRNRLPDITVQSRLGRAEFWRAVASPLSFFPLCLSLLLFVFSYGCPRPQEADVKGDLTKYMDQARLWAATEAQINNAIISVRHDQFVNDDFTINTLRPIVGVAQEYVQQLEKYHPQAKPLQNVHQEYIEAWRAHHFAIAAIVDCVEKKDYIQLAKANTDLLEAQRSVSDALSDLASLLRKAGLRSETATPGQPPPMPPQESPGFSVSPQGS